jgi:hypothetical protein
LLSFGERPLGLLAIGKGEIDMASIGRFWPASIVVVLLILTLGCGEEGGSGAVEPMADEPMVLESVMCLDVDDTRPVGITNSFLKSDAEIYVWIYWTNVEGRSTVEAIWFEPDKDSAFYEESQTIDSSTGFAITWFFIERPAGGFSEGEWSVDIYLDDLFERSHIFSVES